MSSDNGWPEYKRLVMNEIDELKDAKEELHDAVTEIKIELAKIKDRLWFHMVLTGSSAAGGSWLIDWFQG